MSPIFFPKSAVPPRFQAIVSLNPLTVVLEQTKDVLVFGRVPAWKPWLVLLLSSWAVCALGYAWFQRTRKAFADVL